MRRRSNLAKALAIAAFGATAFGQAPGEIEILPVQGNVYMIVGAGANVTASVGPDGVFLVDAGTEAASLKLQATVLNLAKTVAASAHANRCLGLHCAESPYGWTSPSLNSRIASPAPPKPIRYIVNTSVDADHIGGNPRLSELPAGTKIVGVTFPPMAVAPSAIMIAHENVQTQMSDPPKGKAKIDSKYWPSETYRTANYKLSQFFNGEGVQIFHAPNAHTDGDSFVWFRYSDVIAAGDLLNTEAYPSIDVERGGTIQGVLDGLNHILDIAIPEFRSQGGTMVIPGHGRLCDTGDVGNYRNMVAIMRDRIQALVNKGMTLEQVKAAKPTMDYDGLYGNPSAFIEASYKTLKKKQ